MGKTERSKKAAPWTALVCISLIAPGTCHAEQNGPIYNFGKYFCFVSRTIGFQGDWDKRRSVSIPAVPAKDKFFVTIEPFRIDKDAAVICRTQSNSYISDALNGTRLGEGDKSDYDRESIAQSCLSAAKLTFSGSYQHGTQDQLLGYDTTYFSAPTPNGPASWFYLIFGRFQRGMTNYLDGSLFIQEGQCEKIN